MLSDDGAGEPDGGDTGVADDSEEGATVGAGVATGGAAGAETAGDVVASATRSVTSLPVKTGAFGTPPGDPLAPAPPSIDGTDEPPAPPAGADTGVPIEGDPATAPGASTGASTGALVVGDPANGVE